MTASRLLDFAIAGLVAFLLLLALVAIAAVLQEIGPAGRVVVYEYLISASFAALLLYCALVAGLLGFETLRRLTWRRLPQNERAPQSLLRVTKPALALLCAWLAAPHVFAFPADGSPEQRERWARMRVPEYEWLTAAIARVPDVVNDVGPVTRMAPTGARQQRAAREMHGMGFLFQLEVSGPKGSGVFDADCVVDHGHVTQWDPGRWTFRGTTRVVSTAPPPPR